MAKKGRSGKKGKGSGKRKGRMNRKMSTKEFEAHQRKGKMVKGLIAVFIIVIIAVLISLIPSEEPPAVSYNSPYEIIGDEISIKLSDLSTTANYFSYNAQGTAVKFFAVRGSDGNLHTAFDACDVCFQEKKGYYQDGNDMVCRNCGNRYTTNQIGTANQSGGCWPSYLGQRTDGESLRIKIADLENGKSYF